MEVVQGHGASAPPRRLINAILTLVRVHLQDVEENHHKTVYSPIGKTGVTVLPLAVEDRWSVCGESKVRPSLADCHATTPSVKPSHAEQMLAGWARRL